MNSYLVTPAIMAGLGLFFAVILAVAYRFLKVREDPRIKTTLDLLPGSNCAACGQPGCRAFAVSLVAGRELPNRCTVANSEAIDAITELLDVEPGKQEQRVAQLHCAGGKGQAIRSPSTRASRATWVWGTVGPPAPSMPSQ